MKFLKLAAIGAALVAASTIAQAGTTFDNVRRFNWRGWLFSS